MGKQDAAWSKLSVLESMAEGVAAGAAARADPQTDEQMIKTIAADVH